MKRLKFKAQLAFWGLAGLVVLSNFNNCAKVAFDTSLASSKNEMQSAALILINKDDPYTKSELVEVNLQGGAATEVYVTNDPTCASGGTWGAISDNVNWKLKQLNQTASVYAKFRNVEEGVETTCVSDSILHDDINPETVLARPRLATNVRTPIFDFIAGDTGSGLKETTCAWPGQAPVNCQFSSSNGNLAEGSYAVSVVAKDNAGNVADPKVQQVIVDRTAPTVVILSGPPATGAVKAVEIVFSAVDNLSGVKSTECSWDNGATYAACATPIKRTVIDGTYAVLIRATDDAGNVSLPATHNFIVDSSAPTVTITSGPSDFSTSPLAAFAFVGMDDGKPLTNFECRLDAAAFAACTSPTSYSALAEGLHKFEVRARDAAGNMSAPAVRSWYIDTIKPVITITSKPAALGKAVNVMFIYSVTDVGSGVDTIKCSLDSAAYADCNSTSMAYNALAQGSHNFRIRATDKAGNVTDSVPYAFFIDTTVPTLRFTAVPTALTNVDSFNFQFSATDANGIESVECRLDNAAFLPCASMMAHLQKDMPEGNRRFGIRAYDRAGNVSGEVSTMFQLDLTGPTISYLQQPPAAVLQIDDVKIQFTAADALSGIKSVKCTLNGTDRACSSDVMLTLTGLAAGNYVFIVTATDNAGNVKTDTRNFTVSSAVLHNQAAQVKQYDKVDILVIMDNSGSMADEQKNMGMRFSSFLDKIKALDWQIGITTTDPRAAAPTYVSDGLLSEIKGMTGKYILTSAMDRMAAQTAFSATVQMGTNGSGDERGIYAPIRSINRAKNPADMALAGSENLKALFREDAALAMIVVSDAAESKSAPQELINLVKAKWPTKPFAYHSIVVPESIYTTATGPVDPKDPCAKYRESYAYDGRTYHALSDLTGGIKGTVCSENYGDQLADMGKITADLLNSVSLDCAPIDINGDGKVTEADIDARKPDGSKITGFTVAGAKLSFPAALPVGANSFKYYCK